MDEEYLVKDHFQDVLLTAIYNSIPEADILVFKGGTAVRKIYGIDRYSDDLDFNLVQENLSVSPDDFVYYLRGKCIALISPPYSARMYVHKVHARGSYGIDAMVKDNAQRAAKIRIEISGKRIYRKPLEKRVLTQESTYFASVMNIDEILAEKLRAVYTRRSVENTARDLVDIEFLDKRGGKFDLELTNEKLKEVNHTPFSIPSFSKRVRMITDDVWQSDLVGIMQHVPDRKEIIKGVMEFVRG